MKILHIFPEFRRGGAPLNTLRAIKETKRLWGDSLEHLVAARRTDQELYREFLFHAHCYNIDLTRPRLGSFVRLWKLAQKEKVDIVHANGKAGTVYGLFLSWALYPRPRLFLTLRGFHDKFQGLKSKFYRFLEKRMAQRAEKIICVSPSERAHYLELIHPPQDKVVVLPNGIDLQPTELPQEIAEVYQKYGLNIISLSRITPQKDLECMIRAFTLVCEESKDIALHIMGGLSHGEDGYRAHVEDVHRKSPFSGQIYFWGDVKGAGNLIHHFQLYFSTARFEGLPTAVVEAFLSRIPVVGSRCIGNIDLIRSGKTGWLFPVGDPQAAARALGEGIRALRAGTLLPYLDLAESVGLQYSLENHGKGLVALYNEGLDKEGDPEGGHS